MSKTSAIQAAFADFKLVRGRKVAQLVFEVAIEQADAALAALGGLPSSIDERWCGIARLDLSAAKPKAQEDGPDTRGVLNVGLEHIEYEQEQKTRRKMTDLPTAQRAALLCQRQAFQRWMREECGFSHVLDEQEATNELKSWCAISSRSELATNSMAAAEFEGIERSFNEWLNQP
jgi:hypothetical protein